MMIQDIEPKHLFNAYHPDWAVRPQDTVLMFEEGEVFCIPGEAPRFPTVQSLGLSGEDCRYLFSVEEQRFYLHAPQNTEGLERCSLRTLRENGVLPREMLFAVYTGRHLADWYRDTVFCGRCGQRMTHSQTERAMTCTCGYTAYPRIMPAVIVGVKDGNRLLLTRYRKGYNRNALVAGFTEIGETL